MSDGPVTEGGKAAVTDAVNDELTARSEHLYAYDAEFHAKVYAAVNMADRHHRDVYGGGLTESEILVARRAAAYALTLADHVAANGWPS